MFSPYNYPIKELRWNNINLTPVFWFNFISCRSSKKPAIKPTVTGSQKLPCLCQGVASPWNVFLFPHLANSCSFLDHSFCQYLWTHSPHLCCTTSEALFTLCYSQSHASAFILVHPVLTFWSLPGLPVPVKPETNQLLSLLEQLSFLCLYHTGSSPPCPIWLHSRSTWDVGFGLVSLP